MKIFVAGATGTFGRPVVRTLASHGHEVVGMSRSERGARQVEALGAAGVIGNALDADRMVALLRSSRPDQVVHLLTALPPAGVLRKRQLQPTNELRVHGTANLLRAAQSAGVRRFVAESFVGVYGPGVFDSPIAEEDPLLPVQDGPFKDAVLALRSLEDQLRSAASAEMGTVALRIGLVYGAEVPSTKAMIEQARAGRLYVPRGLSGIVPFVHLDDAVAAIVSAVEHPRPAPVYNVADDEPVALRRFMVELASAVSASPPRELPAWIVRLGAPVIAQMGSAKLPLSNAKVKRELGWTLRYPSIRHGLAELRSHRALAA